MKKIVLLAVLIGLGMSSISAQNQSQVRDQNRAQQRVQQREHYMFQDGKMYQVRNGERVQLQNQLKLKNGTTINPDGSFQFRNGKRKQFRNGEYIGLDGKRYKDQNRYMTRMNRMEKQQMNRPGTGPKRNKSGRKKGKGGM